MLGKGRGKGGTRERYLDVKDIDDRITHLHTQSGTQNLRTEEVWLDVHVLRGGVAGCTCTN